MDVRDGRPSKRAGVSPSLKLYLSNLQLHCIPQKSRDPTELDGVRANFWHLQGGKHMK